MIYLYHQNWLYGLSAKLTGFTPVPDGLIRLRDTRFKG
jgi:peptide/nickel transport system substrate-binding protein